MNSTFRYYLRFFCILLSLVMFATPVVAATERLSVSQIEKIMKGIGDHLGNMQQENGLYHYEYNPFLHEFTHDDNEVRQLGSFVGMVDLYEIFQDPIYLDRMKKTVRYWLSQSKTVEKDDTTLRYFPSGKSGSNALFVIGMSALKRYDQAWWHENQAQAQEVLNLLLWEQKRDGSFIKHFVPTLTGEGKEHVANLDYFDGEAMLALIRWYKVSPQESIREAIYKSLSYWEENYTQKYPIGLYLWAMHAMREGYETFEDERFVVFANTLQALRDKVSGSMAKSFLHNRCSTLEGLAQWLFLEQSLGVDRPEHQDYLDYALRRTARFQVQRTKLMRISYSGLSVSIRPKVRGVGGILTDINRPVQRIDFQQHCISAYRGWLEFLQ